jgi:hypothetical protein
MESKTVYHRLQKVRRQLVELNLKKSGKNTYSNFTYYELGDFLPTLNRLMDEAGIATRVIFPSKDQVVLEVINSDKPEDKVVFMSPTADVEIGRKKDGTGGADPIQNLGGKITYMRRYMLMVAFEIAENDAVDAQKPVNEAKLDDATTKQIRTAKTLEELVTVCKNITTKKPALRNLVLREYTARKNELEA